MIYNFHTAKAELYVMYWQGKLTEMEYQVNEMLLAAIEWEDVDVPEWFSNCSERWNLGDSVSHWCDLPEPPK